MVVMMDMEIRCKGHCEKLSHFLDHVSHTVYLYKKSDHFLPRRRNPVPQVIDRPQYIVASGTERHCSFISAPRQ